jgi:hypothetical protein
MNANIYKFRGSSVNQGLTLNNLPLPIYFTIVIFKTIFMRLIIVSNYKQKKKSRQKGVPQTIAIFRLQYKIGNQLLLVITEPVHSSTIYRRWIIRKSCFIIPNGCNILWRKKVRRINYKEERRDVWYDHKSKIFTSIVASFGEINYKNKNQNL